LEAKEDSAIPGITASEGERPGIKAIIEADGQQYVHEADSAKA
jgi:hypothetical protein